ncbi:MAG: DUF3187 family protein [Candidatus Lambdaproteobacteria bacterium]|nr:DUF3187 family protein [Candidatus Lambdaproteobacteria bacterium]
MTRCGLAGWSAAFALAAALFAAPAGAVDNGGLGPLPIRNQFPPGLPYLSYQPEPTPTLADGGFRMLYQYAIANTFVNTQSPDKSPPACPPDSRPNCTITGTEVGQGLTAANFPATGYGAYLDMEVERHQLSFRYGLFSALELGLDLAWLNFGGGRMDGSIEDVEKRFGAFNESRAFSDRNRFDYYLYRNGEAIHATSRPAGGLMQDPVYHVKWGWSDGGDYLPAISVKLSYKQPLDGSPSPTRQLVSSGRSDTGGYLLLSKAIGNWVGHFQFGSTQLGIHREQYSERLLNKTFALEYRTDSSNSWLLQIATQSNIFRKRQGSLVDNDFLLSRATDVLIVGHKFKGDRTLFDFGAVEDFNSRLNETDIVFFLDLGWQW